MKLRTPETFEDAALEVGVGLGFAEAGQLVGRSDGAVRAWADPDKDGRPTLHQALAVDAAYARSHKGRTPFLAAYVCQLRKVLDAGGIAAGDVLSEALDVPGAVGQLIETIKTVRGRQSERGAVITPHEHKRVRAAMRDLRRELDELEAAVDAEALDAGRRP